MPRRTASPRRRLARRRSASASPATSASTLPPPAQPWAQFRPGVNEQKVDKLQDASETLARSDDVRQEVNVIRYVSEAQMDLDTMLSSEVQDTRKETSGLGDDKPAQEGKDRALVVGDDGIVTNFDKLVPDMAIKYPFELDKFQMEAIYYLENGESVFVAAHTSAGKTVTAEYAFALATKHCTKAVYTVPLKTINNQKYRDFCWKFHVGSLTGDVNIRPESNLLNYDNRNILLNAPQRSGEAELEVARR